MSDAGDTSLSNQTRIRVFGVSTAGHTRCSRVRMIKSARSFVGSLAVLSSLVACGGAEEGDASDDIESGGAESALTGVGPEVNDAITQAGWERLGFGVKHKAIPNGGSNVLAVYGGYSAEELYVDRWADELVRARGQSLGIGHLYSVKGPNQSGYANKEIANSKLALHLGTGAGVAASASSIIVVAHSSGTFVASELFAQLKKGTGGVPSDTLGKVTLFNLDGGGGDGSIYRSMAHAYFVYACDANIGRCSHNDGAMRSLGSTYASAGGAIKLKANGSGCNPGGLWCLHDTLITNRPHNPDRYDLARDYTDFTGSRHVVTDYLDRL